MEPISITGSNGDENTKERDLDEILDEIGTFGKYQKLLVFCVLLPIFIPAGIHSYTQVFIAAVPESFGCRSVDNQSLPSYLPENVDGESSQCTQYDVNLTTFLSQSAFNWTNFLNAENATTVSCKNGWEYDKTDFTSTVVTSWDLVCDKKAYPTYALFALTVGELVCAPIFGAFSDRFGRKRSFFLCLILQLLFGTATAFSPDFISFCVFRFFLGGTYGPMYVVVYILGLETVGTKYRATYAVLAALVYAIGCILAGAISWLVRDWFSYTLWTSLPFIPFLLYWFFIPESPNWLLAAGKERELSLLLCTIAKRNNPTVSVEFLNRIEADVKILVAKTMAKEKTGTRVSYLDLFLTPRVRRSVLIMAFINGSNLIVYSGLSYYGPAVISGSPQISYMLITAAELPANLVISLTADRFGRKIPFITGLVCSGIACLSVIAVDESNYWAYLATTMLAKLLCTVAYGFAELLESEVFPTVIRNQACAFTELVASLLATAIPVIIYLGYTSSSLPLLIFGCLAIVSGIMAIWIPETLNKELPITIQDAEDMDSSVSYRTRKRFKLGKALLVRKEMALLRSVKHFS